MTTTTAGLARARALVRDVVASGRAYLPLAIAVGGTFVAYAATRLWMAKSFPYFLDEGILADYAQRGLDPDRRLESLTNGIRPGMVWMAMGLLKFPLGALNSLRLVAVAFGLVILVSGTLFALRWYGGRGAAAAYAALAVLVPFLFLYDALGERDTVIAGLAIAGLLLQVELARRPQLWLGLLLGLSFGLDLLVKDSGKPALYFLPLSLIVFPWRAPRLPRRLAAWAGNVVLAYAIAWAGTFPMRLTLAYKNLHATLEAMAPARTSADVRAHFFSYLRDGFPPVADALTAYVTWPVLVLALVGLVLGLWRRPAVTMLVAVWGGAHLASVIWLASTPYPRYLVPAIPFVLLLAAFGLQEVVAWLGTRIAARRTALAATAAVVLVVLAPGVVADAKLTVRPASASYPPIDRFQYITGAPAGTGVRQLADEILRLAGGHDLWVVWDDNPHSAVALLTLPNPGIHFTRTNLGDAVYAKYLVTNGPPPPPGYRLREEWRYDRPHGGTPLVLYRILGKR